MKEREWIKIGNFIETRVKDDGSVCFRFDDGVSFAVLKITTKASFSEIHMTYHGLQFQIELKMIQE